MADSGQLTKDPVHEVTPGPLAPFTATVERGRLRFFARVVGLDDSEFTSLERARAAGHPDLPVPPTFLFGLELEHQQGEPAAAGPRWTPPASCTPSRGSPTTRPRTRATSWSSPR